MKELKAWIEGKLTRNIPALKLKENNELRKGMTTTIGRNLNIYLPKVPKKPSVKTLKKVQQSCEHALVDALIPIADWLAAEGKSIGSIALRQLIKDLSPDPNLPHTFLPLLPLLSLPKGQRLPKEKPPSPKRAALEEAEGGLALLLFFPEKVRLVLLRAVTYPLTSSLQENPEAVLSLTDPNVIDPDTNRPITIRKKVQNFIASKGINSQSYPTIRALTKEIRSLHLLSLDITPKVLSQTIAQQLANGATETSPVIKILTLLHDDLLDFETRVGFPIRLVKTRARLERKLKHIKEPLQVGLQQIDFPQRPLEIYHTKRGELRKKLLEWGIKRGIYETKTEKGKTTKVENRILRPIAKPIRFVTHRIFRPTLARLGRTAAGQTVKVAWGKVKSAATKAIWTTSKQGLKKAAISGAKAVAAKLGLTKISAAIGTAIGGPLGTAAGTAFGFVADKTVGLIKRTFRGLKNFLFGREQRATRAVYSFGDFLQRITSGEALFPRKDRSLVFIIAGTFILLFALLTFFNIGATSAWLEEKIPTETRYLKPEIPGRKTMRSDDLMVIFEDAAERYCVPKAMLLAISQMEASGTWNYTDTEVEEFIEPGWWDEAGCVMSKKVPGDCTKGYCYNTCAVYPELGCSEYSVVGPMQFEEGTWIAYLDDLGRDLGHEPHRCNLRDSVFAAAMKIKTNSGTGSSDCDNWSEDIVHSTARAYCGSCGITEECGENPTETCKEENRACGWNYCQAVVALYNEY